MINKQNNTFSVHVRLPDLEDMGKLSSLAKVIMFAERSQIVHLNTMKKRIIELGIPTRHHRCVYQTCSLRKKRESTGWSSCALTLGMRDVFL